MYPPLVTVARTVLPQRRYESLRRKVHRLRRPAWLGTLRRTTPLSSDWGQDRGTPIDRYYIDRFLAEHLNDIRGSVLEIKDGRYTERFGVNVTRRDVLDVDRNNAAATIYADLAAAHTISSCQFDCFIVTQTFQYIYDLRAALSHAYRILRGGGVLLVTVPSISRMDCEFEAIDYWRFTVSSCRVMFQGVFGDDQVSIRAYGNVLAGTAFWNGMAAEELRPHELDTQDERFPVTIGVRAVKTRL
jgi:SAM-dependent methyltransferase